MEITHRESASGSSLLQADGFVSRDMLPWKEERIWNSIENVVIILHFTPQTDSILSWCMFLLGDPSFGPCETLIDRNSIFIDSI